MLGPVCVVVDGRQVPVGGPKPRTLLALLATRPGRVVSAEHLIDAIWGEDPPDTARALVHTYVSAIRKAVDAEVISRDAGGYRLDAEEVDLTAFRREADAGARAAPDQAVDHFRAALRHWRGPALGGAQGSWAENERARLEELRLGVLEDLAEAGLTTGQGADLIGELTEAVAQHPLRERLRAQLMRALHQAGRQADALACYQEGHRALVEELGVDPGPLLRQAHGEVLAEPLARPEPEPATVTPPGQLPFDIADFTGRASEVAALSRLLVDTSGYRLCALSGKPGSGKSTLALHVAHRVRAHFPDGQLYASLRGVQTVRSDPAEVLVGFLRALGVADAAIPVELDERAQLYRTLLADRRVLIVLDDASDERQIRPLLPGAPTCAVLVTSRERLGALGGAHQLDLHVFDDAEALQLLDRVVGGGRAQREAEHAQEIVRLCGHLPLALRIAGARLAARVQWPLARLADRLKVQHRVLQELMIGDLEVRGSLALSFDELGELERTALRRLGLLDVSSFGGWIVAPLLGCDAYTADEVVERLVDAQLLDPVGARYKLHDLTRAFARERGEAEETGFPAVADRVARCLLALVEAAGARMPRADFDWVETSVSFLDRAKIDEILDDPEEWFDAEQTELVGFVERISELDLTEAASKLAAALSSSRFAVRNLFSQWYRTHNAALEAARRVGDKLAEARLLAGLGWLRFEQDRLDEAASYYEQALELSDGVRFQALTRLSLSTVHREQGRLAEARTALDLSLAGLRTLDEPKALAQAIHGLGRVLCEQGDLDEAVRYCTDAVAHYRELGNARDLAIAMRSVGIVHRAAGRLDEADRWCSDAVTLLERLDNKLASAYAVQSLAKVRVRQGRGAEVREALVEALETCNEMQDGFGQALVLRTLGELELAEGDLAEARRRLEHALRWWDALALTVWRARTLRDLAAVLDASGESGEEQWSEALAIFRRYGNREAREPRLPVTLTL
ncbi:BTAD domain-containing putative transcriptional regulator [Lentzea sp. DG1S-22]|uniref:AfsR/SARP family transcriptional regulator n=1 Tax=Lentzea sp. DG1S-22 TaxID=3108822 RepID=UPI002E78A92E|nr:BTAD domain-containing putative transcriptional regulator [Lentzea sp. DG1S-22]WVH77571.1 BTAD domain-containing putative transcriptional regulator [Lentzea sp. DG1S-22]